MPTYGLACAEGAPTRTSQLNPAAWLAAGYNEQDTLGFLRSYSESMYHPNIRIDIRIKGGTALGSVWAFMAANLFNMSTSQLMKTTTQKMTEFFNTTFVSK